MGGRTRATLLALAVIMSVGSSAQAAPRVAKVVLPEVPGAEQGSAAKLAITLKARSAQRRAAFHARLLAKKKPMRSDPILLRFKSPALKKRRKKATLLRSGRVPKSTAPGVYRIAICQGKPARVPRRSRCRAAAERFAVIRNSAEPRPIDVQFETDATRMVQSPVTAAAGGTLTTRGADGSVFTLQIPADALLVDTTISMTPLTALRGLPGGAELAAGVQLEPEGLTFSKPVVLTIDHPADVDPRTSAPFGAQAGGKDFHLDLGSVEKRRTSIELFHFTYGGRIQQVTTATTSYIDARRPGRREAAARGAVARELLEARRAALLGDEDDADVASMTETALFLWARDGIVPDFETARTDEAMERYAIQQALSMERTAQLSGVESPRLQAYTEDFTRWSAGLIERALYRAWKRCVEDHDLTQFAVALGYIRAATLYGIAVNVSFASIQGCYKFELDGLFRFRYETDGGKAKRAGALKFDALPIASDLAQGGRLAGTKALEWISFTPECTQMEGGCTSKGTTVERPVTVYDVKLPTDSQIPKHFGVPQPPLPPVVLDIDIGGATSCYGPAAGDYDWQICEQLHAMVFSDHHQAEVGEANRFKLAPWEFVGEAVYARYVADLSLATCSEGFQNPCSSYAELTLRHTPTPAEPRPVGMPPKYPDAPAIPTGVNAPRR